MVSHLSFSYSGFSTCATPVVEDAVVPPEASIEALVDALVSKEPELSFCSAHELNKSVPASKAAQILFVCFFIIWKSPL
jgi:hypothetical protein